MRFHLIITAVALVLAMVSSFPDANAQQPHNDMKPRETRISVGNASLYARSLGQGQPLIVLHGGPDFDHAYLLPDLDRLKDAFQLVYYDQRGRGLSAKGFQPRDVTLASEMDDLDRVRQHFGLEAPTLLGHSWGTVLALEYAVRYPSRVSRLILMNPAPASANDYALLRTFYLEKIGAAMSEQQEILASPAYRNADPETVAARYRIHFRPAFKSTQDYENLMATMKSQFVAQGKDGILEARAVEDRLMSETWQKAGYDLLPRLRDLRIPTLVITGDHDFIPIDISEHIARALPDAELTILKDCGHFTYLECDSDVRKSIDAFMRRTREGTH